MFDENNITDEEFSIGSKIKDRYLIDKILGSGGQGFVVKALDTENFNNPVVIKALHKNIADKWSLDKFKEEQRALADLQGATGIVNLIGSGKTESGRAYTILEFVDGELLTNLIDDLPNNLPRVAGLFEQITLAIEYAHQRGIYHRDLKPDNIIIAASNTKHERIKIIDFGIAKQTIGNFSNVALTENIIGTPFYISPNALDGKPNPPADDIYALGIIAYEMVTGRFPVSKENFSFGKLVDMQKRINEYPPGEKNGRLSKVVDDVILKALSENPADRYRSAEAFGDELCRALLRPIAEETQPIRQTENSLRKGKGAFLISLILLGFLLALSGIWAIFRFNKNPEIVTDSTAQNSNNVANVAVENKNSNSLRDNTISNSAPAKTPAPTVTPIQSQTPDSASISSGDFTVALARQGKGNESLPASTAENFKAKEGIRLNISSVKDGFLQIFLKNNDGKVQKVFNSKINAGKPISFPSPRWIVFDDIPGTETIYVVISDPDKPEKTDAGSLDDQSGGDLEFTTEKGSAVKIIKINHDR